MAKRIVKIIKYFKDCLLSLIYPEVFRCLSCGKEISNSGICSSCEEKIIKVSNGIYVNNVEVQSCAYYAYTIKTLIFNLKYNGDFNSGNYLVDLMEKKFDYYNKVDYITYVPTSKDKLKKRGFNQCEFLAKELSERLEIPYVEVLKKKQGIKEQKTLSKYERESNIKDAFKLVDNHNLKGKSVLLIDDILTTGSTIKACINELQKIESISLKVLTIGTNSM